MIMPTVLNDTPMANTWNQMIELAKTQNVDPATGQVDVSSLPADDVQALVSLGTVEVKPVDGKTMATLKGQADPGKPATQDVSGAQAAAKPHTFAEKPA